MSLEARGEMTQLNGQLAGVGLPAIIRFLSGLEKTGCLRLSQDDWSGEVVFAAGEVADARLGSRSGLAALDGMLEMFPEATFTFASPSSGDRPVERTIQVSKDALLAHLDERAARLATAGRRLPRPNAVPHQAADGSGEEPLPLDRGTLQTLLAVDGQRSVRDIVDMRQSMEPVWHLASLAEVGLISFNGTSSSTPAEPANNGNPAVAAIVESDATTLITAAPVPQKPAQDEAAATGVSHCSKLGFEDDPASSFGRPTRLHRCFAAGTPTPLSLEQQRELCLSDHFETCPRLTAAPSSPAPKTGRPGPRRVEPTTSDEPRIVRLPFGSRLAAAERKEAQPAASEPTLLRPAAPAAREDTATRPAATTHPARMRARLERPTPAAAPSAAVTASTLTPTPPPAPRPTTVAPPREPIAPPPVRREPVPPTPQPETPVADYRRRIGQIPVVAIAAAGAGILVIAAMLYLLVPQLFGDSGLDEATLPNARLVQEGTPVSALAPPRATPIAAASAAAAASGGDTAQATPETAAQPTRAAAAAAQASVVPAQTTPASAAGQPASSTSDQPLTGALFDERFATNSANWPSNPQGLGLFTNGGYRIATRQAGQFAAIGAPVSNVPADVAVTADFRKLGGPDGGGYGIIVRDQQQGPRDGSSQDGRYYVLEVGDKGEVGIWRRDGDHWVDLLPWQRSDAVKTGTAPNQLSVRAIGDTLSLSVNGTEVATKTDSTLSNGQVGVFVGGDGNQVALTRFTVQNP
jgi:hypothetical protein